MSLILHLKKMMFMPMPMLLAQLKLPRPSSGLDSLACPLQNIPAIMARSYSLGFPYSVSFVFFEHSRLFRILQGQATTQYLLFWLYNFKYKTESEYESADDQQNQRHLRLRNFQKLAANVSDTLRLSVMRIGSILEGEAQRNQTISLIIN